MAGYWRFLGLGGLATSVCLVASSAVAQQLGGDQPAPCSGSVSTYFEAQSSQPTEAMLELLDYLPQSVSGCRLGLIVVVGHSDAAEAASRPSIGQDRADAVAAYLRAALPDVPVLTEDARYTAPARPSTSSEPQNRRATIYLR